MSGKRRVLICGHNGMVGSAILRRLAFEDRVEILTANRDELDLSNRSSVDQFFSNNSIEQVYLAAAKVGGINANNKYPADFIHQNLLIEMNVVEAAYRHGVDRLLFLGSSCIYPRSAKQPIREEYLLSGGLEPTNEPYAIAKIAGIKLCESYNRQYSCDYRSVMPTNLFGRNDNFHPDNSHVIPGLLRRFHEAKLNGANEVVVWGSGRPKREFLHVDDMAEACVHIMNLPKSEYWSRVSPMQSHINVGSGVDSSIHDVAEMIKHVTGFTGDIVYDTSKPDGTPRKLLDVSTINEMGWKAKISLLEGLRDTYSWYLDNSNCLRS
ncbi:GDP-L-fucose synthase [Halomonas sp. H33-56]|uniref:GDP-L-fucose synthase n=1 Tax=Halomonas sp. H33-56 TaxID=2950873 RepID=UPI0032DEA032